MAGHKATPPEGTTESEYVARCAECGDWITKAERATYDRETYEVVSRRTFWQHVGNRAADIRSGRRERIGG